MAIRYVHHPDAQQKLLAIDLGNIEIREDLKQLLIFNVATYEKLFKPGEWEGMLSQVNDLFRIMSKEQQEHFIATILSMHTKIKMFKSSNSLSSHLEQKNFVGLADITEKLAQDFFQFYKSIGLRTIIHTFVKKNLPAKVDPKIGTRPQDKKEYTFFAPEIEELTELVIICKMLVPIFGAFMSILSKGPKKDIRLDSKLKEYHSFNILKYILEDYGELRDKLLIYIEDKIVDKCHLNENSAIFNLQSRASLINSIIVSLFTRNFVNVPLDTPDGNLMVFTCVSSKKVATSQIGVGGKTQFFIRTPPPSGDGEDGNTSTLEIDTLQSVHSAFLYPFIDKSLRVTRDRLISDYNISKRHIRSAKAYYSRNPVTPHMLNTFITNAFFHKYISGGKGFSQLNEELFTECVIILQLILLKMEMPTVAFMLTTNIDDSRRNSELTENRSAIQFNWANSNAYKKCRDSFRNDNVQKMFKEQIEAIVKFIVYNFHYANVPDFFYEVISEENFNGQNIDFPKNAIEELCEYILKLLPDEEGDIDDIGASPVT